MSINGRLLLKGTTIQQIRAELLTQLQAGEIDQLLTHILNCSRTHLYAHPETSVNATEKQQLAILLQKRASGVPLAYLTGKCDFFSLELIVSPQVLIPRPETEMLVQLALKTAPHGSRVLDLGTGCGAIAVALAHERSDLSISASDISPAAIEIARDNAARYTSGQIHFVHSDWFSHLSGQRFDIILSNPPYVTIDDPALDANTLAQEPDIALLAANNGLACLEKIVRQAPQYLSENGLLVLEHGFQQAPNVMKLLEAAGFSNIRCLKDFADLPRVSIGEWKM